MRTLRPISRACPGAVSRAELAETALAATDGGEVIALTPVSSSGRIWHATVLATDGAVLDVRLDLRLRTASVATPSVPALA